MPLMARIADERNGKTPRAGARAGKGRGALGRARGNTALGPRERVAQACGPTVAVGRCGTASEDAPRGLLPRSGPAERSLTAQAVPRSGVRSPGSETTAGILRPYAGHGSCARPSGDTPAIVRTGLRTTGSQRGRHARLGGYQARPAAPVGPSRTAPASPLQPGGGPRSSRTPRLRPGSTQDLTQPQGRTRPPPTARDFWPWAGGEARGYMARLGPLPHSHAAIRALVPGAERSGVDGGYFPDLSSNSSIRVRSLCSARRQRVAEWAC